VGAIYGPWWGESRISPELRCPVGLFEGGRPGTFRDASFNPARSMRALFLVIDLILQLYIWLLVAAAVLSWLIAFNVVNTRNQLVSMIGDFLYRITEPVLRPIRNLLSSRSSSSSSCATSSRSTSSPTSTDDVAEARPWSATPDGLTVTLRLTPRGGRDSIDGIERRSDGQYVLKARVRAAASEGRRTRRWSGLSPAP
jgi:hypothetical protein